MTTPEIPDEIRPYVEELRQEAAGYRTKYAKYRDAFDGFRDDETEFLLNLVAALKAEDIGPAAKTMRDMAFDLLGERWTEDAPWSEQEETQSQQEEEEVPDENSSSPQLTAEEIQRILDERDAKAKEEANEAELQRMIEEVHAEAKALGYEPDTPDYYMLIQTGMHKTNGDLTAAAALIAPITGVAASSEAPAEEAAEAEPSAPRFPKPVSGGAGAPPAEAKETPKNLAEARDAMHDWLSTQVSTPTS